MFYAESFQQAKDKLVEATGLMFTSPTDESKGWTRLFLQKGHGAHVIRMEEDSVKTVVKLQPASPITDENLALLSLPQLRTIAREFGYLASVRDELSGDFYQKMMRLLIEDIARENDFDAEDC